jgi:phage terminase large subunit-like protein
MKMTDKTPEFYDGKIAEVQKLLREKEEAFDVAKRGYDDWHTANLRKQIAHYRILLRDLSQDRAASRPAGADNLRGSSAIFYGSNY